MPTARNCPVCGDSRRRPIYQQRFFEGILGDGYIVVVCDNCGTGFADGIPTQSKLDDYYQQQSKYIYAGSGGRESEYDFKRFHVIADQLSRQVHLDATILDIGCATGGLLSVLRGHGFRNVIGVDPSEACVAAAKKHHNIEVVRATFSDLHSWQPKFDLILMVGVLEHLRDVEGSVQIASRLLSPDGLFYASVPDVEGLACTHNAPFQQFSMEHVNFFSTTSLNNVMRLVNLRPREIWQYQLEWRRNITEPIVSGLYEFGSTPSVDRDEVTEDSLRRYIEKSEQEDYYIERIILQLVNKAEPILIWGAGALTRRLLVDTALAQAKIKAFVDSDPSLSGKLLAGVPIWAPLEITDQTIPILVCSIAFEAEIRDKICSQLGLKNPLLFLTSPTK